MHWLYSVIRFSLSHWGYWAIVCALLGENAGLPLPGESVLMFSSFLSHKHTGLQIGWVIITGVSAAVLGDNIGYFIGRSFGSRILRWLKKILHLDEVDIAAAKDQMARHGGATVFIARYIFVLRAIAGPLAGVMGMCWKRFLLFNLLGAVTWVCAVAWAGYTFASQFESLLGYIEKLSWVISGGLFGIGYWLWRRQKKRYRQRHQPS